MQKHQRTKEKRPEDSSRSSIWGLVVVVSAAVCAEAQGQATVFQYLTLIVSGDPGASLELSLPPCRARDQTALRIRLRELAPPGYVMGIAGSRCCSSGKAGR